MEPREGADGGSASSFASAQVDDVIILTRMADFFSSEIVTDAVAFIISREPRGGYRCASTSRGCFTHQADAVSFGHVFCCR